MPKLSTTRLTKTVCDRALCDVWDSEMRGFGLRVSSSGTKTFALQYTSKHGNRTKCKVGRYPAMTVDEARVKARRLLSEVEHGGDPGDAARRKRQTPTVWDLLAYYATTHAKAKQLDEQTVRDAQAVMHLYVPEQFMRRRITDVDRSAALVLIGDALEIGVRREGERIAASRAAHAAAVAAGKKPPSVRKPAAHPGLAQTNRLIAVISVLFETPLAKEFGATNPVTFADQRPLDERVRNFSEDEVRRLLTACDQYAALDYDTSQDAADAVRLLLFTGARLQEVIGAPWSQFDLERGVWVKPSAHTKQSKLHVLGLGINSPAVEVLRAIRLRHPDSAFLFPGRPSLDDEGRATERPRVDLKRPWKAICAMAGLHDDERVHDLRRTTGCFMLDDGASLPTVGAALGHTQATTTQRYAKMRPAVQAEALDRSTRRMVSP